MLRKHTINKTMQSIQNIDRKFETAKLKYTGVYVEIK